MHISLSLLLGALWVIAGTIVAFLPMRYQYAPGILLIVASVPLIAFIGSEHGWIWACIGLMAFVSMFRNPLKFLLSKLRGENPEVPK